MNFLFPTYTEQERILTCAGLLHDIGTSRGTKGHHKASYEIIHVEGNKNQNFGVSYIARYHRKAIPSEAYAILTPQAQEQVSHVPEITTGLLGVI